MKKRMFALALACVLLVAMMAGCGGSGGNAAEGDTIKIGGLAPLTGEVSVYGIATSNGAKMAAEEINAAGGVLGKKIDFILYDEKGDATEAVNAYNKLVSSDKIVGLVGDVTTTPTEAVAKKAAETGMPMITGTASALSVTTAGENVFRACFTDPAQGEILAAYAARQMGAKTAAIIYNNASDYSVGLKETFEKTAAEEGLQIVAAESYAAGDTDFKAQLTNIAGKNPDVLFVPDYYETVALITVQAKGLGMNMPKIGADGWDGVLGKIDASNMDAIEGCIYSSQFTKETDNKIALDFYNNYVKTYGEDPNMFAALGYDAMKIMAQSIADAGSTDSKAVVEAMKKIKIEGATGTITFDENRNPEKSVVMIQLTGGAEKSLGTFEK